MSEDLKLKTGAGTWTGTGILRKNEDGSFTLVRTFELPVISTDPIQELQATKADLEKQLQEVNDLIDAAGKV